MYPGSKVNWYDQSGIQTPEPQSVDNRALFLTASSFDKGPEELIRVYGDEFYSLFGHSISFKKHGQVAIQAANIIDAGGELLIKRIVADDATLANIVFVATLASTTVQAKDDDGNLLYLDTDGNPTTEVTDEIMVENNGTGVTWSAVSIENCYSYEQVVEEALKLFDADAKTFPVIIVTDNGRGVSSKAIRIAPTSEVSASMGVEFYDVSVYEGATRLESISATLNSTVFKNVNYGLEEHSSKQVKFHVDENVFDAFVDVVAEATSLERAEVLKLNLINMTTVKGLSVDGISVSTDSIDMSVTYGVGMTGGTNGEFGDAPVNTTAWEEALVEFYSGNVTNEIYDLDEFKICAVVDACYPYPVKEAIAALATFREDFTYFRDMCFDAVSYATTVSVKNDKFVTNNKFIVDYMTWYQIYDPMTKRRIKVTMMYDFAACLVNAFNVGIHVPTAGIANGFVLQNPIKGTVNFIPRITPTVNQKQMMDDLRVNYAIFYEDRCVVQSLYTSQEAFTQLSFANNVLAIQEVIRAVRTSCPKKRYTFIDDSDFSEYAEHVNNILKEFRSNFETLKFVYQQDNLLANQKIFYACIKFAFKDWAQSEIFDVYAINREEAVEL